MDAAAELGTVSKYQIQPEYEDEQADAGRDCQTRLARANSQARMRTSSIFHCSADHVQDYGNLIRLIHTLSCYMCNIIVKWAKSVQLQYFSSNLGIQTLANKNNPAVF